MEFSYLWKFFTSRGWTKLVPDTGSTFVYCGNSGTGCGAFASLGTGGNNVTNNYVTGAKAHDGSFSVVYFPTNSKDCGHVAAERQRDGEVVRSDQGPNTGRELHSDLPAERDAL
jgi:hypothetical protein